MRPGCPVPFGIPANHMITIVPFRPAANLLLRVATSRTVLSSSDGFQSHGGARELHFQEPSGVAARKEGLCLIFRPMIEPVLASTSNESCEQNSSPSGNPHSASIVTRLPFAVAKEKAEEKAGMNRCAMKQIC